MKMRISFWLAMLSVFISTRAATNSLPAAFNDHGFDLLRRATTARPNENALISSPSLGFSLALFDQAAAPEVEKELNTLLGIAGVSKTQLATSSRLLRESFLKPTTNAGFQLD